MVAGFVVKEPFGPQTSTVQTNWPPGTATPFEYNAHISSACAGDIEIDEPIKDIRTTEINLLKINVFTLKILLCFM